MLGNNTRTVFLVAATLALIDFFAIESTGLLHGVSEALGKPFALTSLALLLPFFGIILIFWFWMISVVYLITSPSKSCFWLGIVFLLAAVLSIPCALLFPDYQMRSYGGPHRAEDYMLIMQIFVLLPLAVLSSLGAIFKALAKK